MNPSSVSPDYEVKSRNDLHNICFQSILLFHQSVHSLSAVVAHVGPAFSCKSAVTCSSIVRFTSRGTWFTDPHPSCRSGLNHTCDRPVTTRAKRSELARGRARVLVACVRLAQPTGPWRHLRPSRFSLRSQFLGEKASCVSAFFGAVTAGKPSAMSITHR